MSQASAVTSKDLLLGQLFTHLIHACVLKDIYPRFFTHRATRKQNWLYASQQQQQ